MFFPHFLPILHNNLVAMCPAKELANSWVYPTGPSLFPYSLRDHVPFANHESIVHYLGREHTVWGRSCDIAPTLSPFEPNTYNFHSIWFPDLKISNLLRVGATIPFVLSFDRSVFYQEYGPG
jgi:hypothetical protein